MSAAAVTAAASAAASAAATASSSTTPLRSEILTAYRALYKRGLRAVQYSAPARYVLRDRLREGFRKGKPQEFDGGRVKNTLMFLRHAEMRESLERRVLKVVLLTLYWEQENRVKWLSMRNLPKQTPMEKEARLAAMDQFHFTVRMLNQHMGMCI